MQVLPSLARTVHKLLVKLTDCRRSSPVPKPVWEPQRAAGPQKVSYHEIPSYHAIASCCLHTMRAELSAPCKLASSSPFSAGSSGKLKPRYRRRRYSHCDLEDWVMEEGPLALRRVSWFPFLRARPRLCSPSAPDCPIRAFPFLFKNS